MKIIVDRKLLCLCTRININLVHLDKYALCVTQALNHCELVCVYFYLLLICCM